MKKIHRHPAAAISRPPTTGPAAIALVPPAAQTAIARARAAGPGKVWLSSASEHAPSAAAPIPCSARAATRKPIEGAAPHATEARVNRPKPPISTRRAPIRSPRPPALRMNAANVSVYASTTHCTPATPPPNVAPIDLTATFTTLTSSWTTANPRVTAASTVPVEGACLPEETQVTSVVVFIPFTLG
jgi:hypothetical protein